ncbi:unnamed protein product [Caenorhabditis brenneri]
MKPLLFLISLFLITVAHAHFKMDNNDRKVIRKEIIIEKDSDEDDDGRRRFSHSHSSSSSSSSSSSESRERWHPNGPRKPSRPSRPPAAKPKCEENWYTSYRPQGIWCLRVGIGHLDYHQAQAQCATYGGVLSGIQNDWERQLIANETVRQLIPHNVNIAGVWLGALKVDGTNTFAWNDGFTTGTEGMFMGPGQPDNALGDARGPQNCLQLIVMTPNYWNAPDKWQTFNRLIDDYWCHFAHDPPQRMYACGKRGPPVTSG